MFDRIEVRQSPSCPQTVNHHEHRAPTDKSVELLNEMEEKMLKRIVCSVHLSDNVFDAVWFVQEDMCNQTQSCIYRFILNGHEYKFDFYLPHKYEIKDGQDLALKVRDALTKNIATILTHAMFQDQRKTLTQVYRNRLT